MDMIFYLLIVAFILSSAYFSGSETAVISADKFKLQSLKLDDKKQKKAGRLLKLLDNPNKILSAILVGNNISVVAATSLCTMLFIRKYGIKGEYYATILMALILLIFGEIFPKVIFRKLANRALLLTYRMLNLFIKLFSPLINGIIFLVQHLPGVKRLEKKQKGVFLTREDLKTIFHISYKQGVIDESDKEIFYGLFDFGATYVREIMVPLVDIVLIPHNRKVLDVIKISKKAVYSRIPVFENHVYDIKGYINVLDLFKAKSGEPISKYIRTGYYVPETKMIDDLFIEMNNKRLPIVFVVDEYGGVSGMVTMEDIVEEIIGEIDQKPQEEEKEQISRVKQGEWIISSDLNIDDINEEIGLAMPKEGFETIAGFIEYYLGKIPAEKESFIYKGYKFSILDSSATSIIKVKIKKIKKDKKKLAKG